jgi:hypothetical protein
MVVDRAEQQELAQAIGRLLDDVTLSRTLVENARERSRIDFNLEAAQDKVKELLSMER